MARRTFKPQEVQSDNNSPSTLPTKQPVAAYYRQSTEAQVGNLSTAIQTIDLVAELEQKGWKQDDILLIDIDEGISGTTKIDERPGMSQLFQLITDGKIGAVACQDEDRLFRDVTQIQVNIFIEACRKSKVQVITPFFTYDFAHPLYGDFHARQFRFKSEMAADFIKSYIHGKLMPAKRRLAKEGKWFGARTPVGYMVDMREHLPDGSENPDYRKFVPFEPYAKVVREYYRILVECGGAIRKSMRRIRKEGISFPDCKPPEGFKTSYQLKWRGDGYYLLRDNFVSLLTNPVYIGHWSYKGAIIIWNNHAPIVETELFMRAFNYLSQYTLTGENNSEYRPAFQYVRPEKDETRSVECPLCPGLIHSLWEDKWVPAGVQFDNRNQCYLYVQHSREDIGTSVMWARRANWLDQAVVSRFKHRLVSTFKRKTWEEAVQDLDQVLENERKLKASQLVALEGAMKNLVRGLERSSDPHFIAEVEKRFGEMKDEQQRFKAELAALQDRKSQQISMQQAIEVFARAVEKWDEMTADEHRNALALFIDRIEASDYDRSGRMRLVVYWRDKSTDEINLGHKPKSKHWTFENQELLLGLVDANASQLEIAATFPDIKWYQIFNEIKKHRGLVRFTPSWLGKDETYRDYLASGGRKGKASGSRWHEEELATLRAMVERQATQLEIMQEFPYRRWIQIKCRIKEIFGKGTYVPLSGISQRLTYIEYTQEQKTVNYDLSSGIAVQNS